MSKKLEPSLPTFKQCDSLWWAYLIYLRPATIPVSFFFAFTGYALSSDKPIRLSEIAIDLILLLISYSILLWGGTNAFNSSQDRDQGKVNLMANPPPIPRYLAEWGGLLMMLSIGMAFVVSVATGLLFIVATSASIYYSSKQVPGRRGKEIPGVDIVINALGCGLLSVLVGYSFASMSLIALSPFLVGLGFSLAIFGGTPTSQIFQLGEDEPNYTSTLGPKRVLRLGTIFFVIHLFFLTFVYPPEWEFNIRLFLWAGWVLLVLAASIHSWWWSQTPMKNPYNRMLRQLKMLMLSQVFWSFSVW